MSKTFFSHLSVLQFFCHPLELLDSLWCSSVPRKLRLFLVLHGSDSVIKYCFKQKVFIFPWMDLFFSRMIYESFQLLTWALALLICIYMNMRLTFLNSQRTHLIEIRIILNIVILFFVPWFEICPKWLYIYITFLMYMLNCSVLHYHEIFKRGPPECDQNAMARGLHEVWCMAIGPGDQD